ncbi:glycosyltransferase family 87 protein [Methylobacterium sp. 17Sr1-1]|uniref:glycosyltransferase family 87 protein n=1 Tax=Methylobacterium sp. 17Sr1-1 TaxID=2202826 RepID=UPI0013A533E8|nr:glycosyltransferase family 87 protein [Methylobacterium sp. 17Sr1-1]
MPLEHARRNLILPSTMLMFLGVLSALPILVRYYRPAGGGLDVTGHPIGRDFINAWAGGRLALSGQSDILFDFGAYHAAIGALFGTPLPFHNWSYPPSTLLLLVPLAWMPYFAALAVWTVGLFAAFARMTLSQVPPGRRLRALLLLALAPACLVNAAGGQNGFLTATLLLSGVLALERRPVLAGILFGLLTCKPQLGLVLPPVLIALGAWRTIAAAVGTTLALVGASLLAFGADAWRHTLGQTSAYSYGVLASFDGFFAYMMTSVFAGARTFGLSMGTAWGLQILVAVPVLAATVWAVRRSRDPLQRAGVIAVAVPLLTPYAFNYDLTLVAAVLVWRISAAEPDAQPDLVMILAWLSPTLTMQAQILGFGGMTVVLVVLFGLLLREVAAQAPARGGLAAA